MELNGKISSERLALVWFFIKFTIQKYPMKKNLLIILFFIFSLATFAGSKTWNKISNEEPAKYFLSHRVSGSATEISFNLPGFFTEEIETPRGNAYLISFPGGGKLLDEGMPDLSQLAFSLVIPDDAEMSAEVIKSQYFEYNLPVAPSKGNLMRNVNPSEVPFTYSDAYSTDKYYPSNIIALRSPYILRDLRGQACVITPFQYNPVTNTLRVYYKLTLSIKPTGKKNLENAISRNKPFTTVDPVYNGVYQKLFLNYSPSSYTPLTEHGRMLIIAESSLMAIMEPFIQWKNKMGQPTVMVDIALIGTDPIEIKSYIEDYYQQNPLTFVLLVGDGPQIPPFNSPSGNSDPSYGYISGNDSYAEVFVGRFSADNISDLETQVQRSISYEMNPDPLAQWYNKGVCIGSNEGPGDDNEMDFEHQRMIREDLLLNNYTLVDELYDGSQGLMDDNGNPLPQDLVNSLNNGRGIVNYTGHGSSSNFTTTNFGISDVPLLTNLNQLPFIWSVACVNGDFNNNTCLAEVLLRSTAPSGEATGAIAAFMSTIDQSWNPPMDAQDEMVDLLVESYSGNVKHTFAGISVNGCMHMNDVYGNDGDQMTDTWHTFGDPSLMVRTNTPFPLQVLHTTTIDELQTSFNVGCITDNAFVCLSKNNQIVSSGWTMSGNVTLNFTSLTAGDTLDVVATAFNAIPYFSKVIITPASTTGIDETGTREYTLFPNPANDNLTISFRAAQTEFSLRLINSLGQTMVIKRFSGSLNNFYLNTTEIANGIYTLELSSSRKIIGIERVIIR